MTDTEKLNRLIDASGYKRSFLAERLGISRETLFKKTKNITEFKASEITALAELLGISDVGDIFFAPNVIFNQHSDQQVG